MSNQKMMHSYCLNTIFGPMKACYVNDQLTHLSFINVDIGEASVSDNTPLAQWLIQYAQHHPNTYNEPLNLCGTPFQLSVWAALQKIPYGETRSYTEIAKTIGRAHAVRAVAQACKQNPIALIVPCHRVIAKNGQLGGYAGQLNHPLKAALLQHEQLAKPSHLNQTKPNERP